MIDVTCIQMYAMLDRIWICYHVLKKNKKRFIRNNRLISLKDSLDVCSSYPLLFIYRRNWNKNTTVDACQIHVKVYQSKKVKSLNLKSVIVNTWHIYSNQRVWTEAPMLLEYDENTMEVWEYGSIGVSLFLPWFKLMNCIVYISHTTWFLTILLNISVAFIQHLEAYKFCLKNE